MAEGARSGPKDAARVEAVLALKRQGLSHSEIGDKVGITKNAVCGIMHRFGGDIERAPKPPKVPKAPPVPSPSPARAVTTPKASSIAPPLASSVPPSSAIVPEPSTTAGQGAVNAVLAVKGNQCRYPIGEVAAPDFRFCCERVPEKASSLATRHYCAAHRDVILAAPAVARRRVAAHG